MKLFIFIISFLFLSCDSKSQVQLTKELDPEIVIINFEEGDKSFIGSLIQKIDSWNPIVIGIDARFTGAKDNYQDSVLQIALSLTNKDIFAYGYVNSQNTSIIHPLERFDTLACKGLAITSTEGGLATYFIPLEASDKEVREHFALQVVRKWMPDFEFKFENNERVIISLLLMLFHQQAFTVTPVFK